MKKLLLALSTMFALFEYQAQTIFWTENFGTNPVCASIGASGSNPSGNGNWMVSNTGTNDILANEWFVSAREAGMGVGNCGDGCVNTVTLTNRTLHVSTSSSLLGDIGAAYSAGPGFSNTDKRAESPTINCSNQSSITLTFSYIMWGIINQDYTQVYYSPDNGTTWNSLGIPPQTPTVACSGQGIWTSYSVALPATANNNATVKVAFRWQNISVNGADPSFAIDDITLKGTASTSSVTMVPTFTLPTSICAGGSTTVTANTGTTTATGYTWTANSPSITIAAPNTSVTQLTFPNSGTYSITLTAAAGTVVGTVVHTIVVNPLPTLTIVPTSSAICAGGQNVLTASGASTFTWMPGNTAGNTLTVTPSANATYTATGTSSLGCINSKTITVNVNALPVIGITPATMSLCAGSVGTLTASGAATFTWLPGSSNGNTLMVTPSANATYTASGTSSLGCVGSSTVVVAVITCTNVGLNNLTVANVNFEIYPNPAKDKVTIRTTNAFSEMITIELFDAAGKSIATTQFSSASAGSSKDLDISTVPNGFYFIKTFSNGKQTSVTKLIKE